MKQNRILKVLSGCKTNGIIDLSSNILFPKLCDDPKCSTCVNFNKAMKEGIEKYLKDNYNEKI